MATQPSETSGRSRSVNNVQERQVADASEYPKISEYGFDFDVVAVVNALEPLGSKVR